MKTKCNAHTGWDPGMDQMKNIFIGICLLMVKNVPILIKKC